MGETSLGLRPSRRRYASSENAAAGSYAQSALMTGDRRAGLLPRRHIERARIVTPAAFCTEVL
jgi:hypothetical protein